MLRQRIREIRKNDKGFTLIELLIVIVILGVLAGIVVFAVQAFNNEGVVAACQTDVKAVEVAEEAYYAKTGNHTVDIDDLVDGGYLKSAPSSSDYGVTMALVAATATAPEHVTVTGTRTAAGGGGTC